MISLSTMSISSIVLGWSINSNQFNIASIFIIMFVACFSLGLGPIPFVLMGEVPPPKVSFTTTRKRERERGSFSRFFWG